MWHVSSGLQPWDLKPTNRFVTRSEKAQSFRVEIISLEVFSSAERYRAFNEVAAILPQLIRLQLSDNPAVVR